jgi:aspartate aminotransferase/aminotransferase
MSNSPIYFTLNLSGVLFMLADRIKKIDSSGIRKVFALAATMKDPINLSIGQPDYDVPDLFKNSAIQAIEKGMNGYTQTGGLNELRETVKAHVNKTRARDFDDLFITSGVSGGLLLAIMVSVNPGDEVLITDPYFVMYKHLVNLMGGVPKFVNTYPDFHLRADEIEKQITDKTKVMILNSPNNPTGVVYSADELKMVADIAKKHGIFIISDEIYDAFSYDSNYDSICTYYENSLVLGGFSKTLAMTGWRVGFAAGNQDIINAMLTIQQYTFVCAPSMAQWACLHSPSYDTTGHTKDYKLKRDTIYDGLKQGGFEVEKPGGAFYIFPKVKFGTDTEFVEKAIKNNVLIIPGSVFSEKNTHFRISFAAPIETLKKGAEILSNLKE